MLIVTGALVARPGHRAALLSAAQAHVARSRAEPGCLHHAVHLDPENPDRLFFFERWEDREALRAHFAQPGTAELMAAVRAHAAGSEKLAVYEATAMDI